MSKRPVCLITGASRGIGAATAKRFAADGYDLHLSARSESQLVALADELRQQFDVVANSFTVDLSKVGGATNVVADCVQQFGFIDVLVNNAGVAPNCELETFSDVDIAATLAVNVAAVIESTKAVIPHMKQRNGGVIVNVSSLAAVDPFPGFSVYGGTKAFVETFTKAISAEGKPHGIRTFCVRPGAVDTPLLQSLFPDFPAEQRLAPEDVAALIFSLCSDELKYSSGEAVTIQR
ncbi:MAG: SDR family oxidoreductase [Planctomycetaceae bacterium]